MADNVTLPGTGAVVSAEEVTTLNGGSVTAQEVQRMLLAARTADGVAVDIGHAEDVAHASGDAGVLSLVVRKDTASALAGTDGDYIPLIVGSDGGLWVRQSQPLPTGTNVIGIAQIRAEQGTWTDRSSTITTGGTAQQLAASNSSRKAFSVQNIGTADLWLSFVGTAAADTAGSIKLIPGAMLSASTPFVSTQAISIIGATTGQKFTAYEA